MATDYLTNRSSPLLTIGDTGMFARAASNAKKVIIVSNDYALFLASSWVRNPASTVVVTSMTTQPNSNSRVNLFV